RRNRAAGKSLSLHANGRGGKGNPSQPPPLVCAHPPIPEELTENASVPAGPARPPPHPQRKTHATPTPAQHPAETPPPHPPAAGRRRSANALGAVRGRGQANAARRRSSDSQAPG